MIMDAGGKEIHRFTGNTDSTGLLREVHQALEGKGLAALAQAYQAGESLPE